VYVQHDHQHVCNTVTNLAVHINTSEQLSPESSHNYTTLHAVSQWILSTVISIT